MSARRYFSIVQNEIADVIGVEATLKLIEAAGGGDIYVPKHSPMGHWLRELIGGQAADKLCDHFRDRRRGITLEMPLGPRRFYAVAREKALAMRGTKSVAEVALELGVTDRSVRNWWRSGTRSGSTRE
jgi:hypothetical protein